MLCKSADLSPSFITMQGHKYSHICNLWGKFSLTGMICTTTDTISIPLGEMYLHARMFCALAHMSSIPTCAINFYMQERFLHSLIPLLFPCLWCFYMQECPVQSLHMSSIPMGANVRAWNLFWASVAKLVSWKLTILLPCTLPYMCSIHMGAINFYIQERFYTLADTTSIQMLVTSSIPMGAMSELETCFEPV